MLAAGASPAGRFACQPARAGVSVSLCCSASVVALCRTTLGRGCGCGSLLNLVSRSATRSLSWLMEAVNVLGGGNGEDGGDIDGGESVSPGPVWHLQGAWRLVSNVARRVTRLLISSLIICISFMISCVPALVISESCGLWCIVAASGCLLLPLTSRGSSWLGW